MGAARRSLSPSSISSAFQPLLQMGDILDISLLFDQMLKTLYRLFLNQDNLTCEQFASKVRSCQSGFMGLPKEVRPGRGEFHESPHTCTGEDSEAKERKDSGPGKFWKGNNTLEEDDQDVDDETGLPCPDDDGDQDSLHDEVLSNGTMLDYDGITCDEPELEEILSD